MECFSQETVFLNKPLSRSKRISLFFLSSSSAYTWRFDMKKWDRILLYQWDTFWIFTPLTCIVLSTMSLSRILDACAEGVTRPSFTSFKTLLSISFICFRLCSVADSLYRKKAIQTDCYQTTLQHKITLIHIYLLSSSFFNVIVSLLWAVLEATKLILNK